MYTRMYVFERYTWKNDIIAYQIVLNVEFFSKIVVSIKNCTYRSDIRRLSIVHVQSEK